MRSGLLAVDGGQSGVRTSLRDDDGTPTAHEFPGVLSDEPLLPQLRTIILDVLGPRRVDTVALGISGLGRQDTAVALKDLLGDTVGTVLLAHDSTTSYLGALGPRQGAVVAAGTGSVTLAVGATRVHRVDGWGHLLGDAGSGFWIGREALSAVLRAHDGRGEPTRLTAVALQEFPDLDQLYLRIQADPQRVSRVASWAKRVAELAAVDPVSAAISQQAGRLLASSVATGLRVVGAEPVVSTLGNVFRNPLVLSSFVDHLSREVTRVEVVEAAGSGLQGAALLPEVAGGSALQALVDRAE